MDWTSIFTSVVTTIFVAILIGYLVQPWAEIRKDRIVERYRNQRNALAHIEQLCVCLGFMGKCDENASELMRQELTETQTDFIHHTKELQKLPKALAAKLPRRYRHLIAYLGEARAVALSEASSNDVADYLFPKVEALHWFLATSR